MTAGASSAEELVANTKLRLTVLQWQPVKGDFSRWDELSGEFSVSTKESLTLPVAGSISVAGKEPDVLAAEIATLIQMKLGLVAAPSTRVEVVEYPPIYVAGDVAEPGEYKYRPGMTVVQALALGGGIYRTSNRAKKDDIQVTGELRGYQIEMLGAQIRIARLEAELAGATSIAFPKPPLDAEDAALVAQMRTQEELVFASRANELQRQTKSLDELRGLLQGEISTLQQKIEISEKSIATAEKELRGVEILVGKGIALASRQSDLERGVASYQSDRLDQATEMMRARQSITETTRSLEGLVDKRRTEVSLELQTERGRLDLLKVKMGVGREMLLDSMSTSDGSEQEVTFSILRVKGGLQNQFPATETTIVQPGDVVTASTSNVPVVARPEAGIASSTSEPAL